MNTLAKVLVTIGCFLLLPAFAHAIDPTDVTSLQLSIDPQFPQAGQTVTITAVSSAIDLNRSTLVWYVNEKIVQQGLDVTTLTTTAGGNGVTKNIRVVAVAPDNHVVQASISITPGELQLTWQASTYTPPFYKGKALYSIGSDITLIAIPTSGTYKPKDLIYTWRKNATPIENSSGLGKDIVTIKSGFLINSMRIAVEAESADGAYHGYNVIDLTPTLPLVRMYKNNPVLGIQFENATKDGDTFTNNETSLEAIPYFFSTTNRFLNDLSMTWTINGKPIDAAQDKTSIIVKRDDSATEVTQASIGVGVDSKQKILQSAQQINNFIFPVNQ